ncbi:MAG: lipopolysaccharide biosynthesis protein [Lachnospiraceae bacterium]|nr:lipopolysaccharide biosynthesis protein [Lachnospiraceae bacterium]
MKNNNDKSTPLSRFLLRGENKIKRNTFFWNAFGAVMNSFQTMLLLLVITRTGNDNDSSIFVMAYAVGNLVLNLGKYGVRQYQVTDVNEEHSLKDYLQARYASMTMMMVAIGAYLLVKIFNGGYTREKVIVILCICLVKAVEAFEDVYQGRMQQKGRLDTAGRILGIRLLIFIIGYAVMYILTKNLVLTSVVNLAITVVLSIIMNGCVMYKFKEEDRETDKHSVNRILIECLPLCACMCLNMYVANAPKYTIDTVVSDDIQTKFNIIFMPVFIIALLANFIFQPFLKGMGETWSEGKTGKLARTAFKFTIVIVIIDLVITFVGSFIGAPVLGAVYGVNLKDMNKELIVFMLAGGLVALQNLYIMIITTVRHQKYMIYGYIGTGLLMLLFSGKALGSDGSHLLRLCVYFFGILSLLTVYCIGLITYAILKRKKQQVEERK